MYRNHAFAKSTAASYKSQLRAYLRFCLFFGYTPVPCRAIHLLRYIVFLARTLSTRSFSNYLNVVHLLHLQYGLTLTLTLLKTLYSSIRKLSS